MVSRGHAPPADDAASGVMQVGKAGGANSGLAELHVPRPRAEATLDSDKAEAPHGIIVPVTEGRAPRRPAGPRAVRTDRADIPCTWRTRGAAHEPTPPLQRCRSKGSLMPAAPRPTSCGVILGEAVEVGMALERMGSCTPCAQGEPHHGIVHPTAAKPAGVVPLNHSTVAGTPLHERHTQPAL